MGHRVITEHKFNQLCDDIMETIMMMLPNLDDGEDERVYNDIDDALQHAIRDLFVFEEAK